MVLNIRSKIGAISNCDFMNKAANTQISIILKFFLRKL